MGVDFVEGLAGSVFVVAIGAEVEGHGHGLAVVEAFFVGWKVELGEGLFGDVFVEGGGELGIGDEVFAGRVKGERAGGVAFVAGFALEFYFFGDVGIIVEWWVEGEVLDDGEVAPVGFVELSLHEEIDAGDFVGEGGDMVEHGFADDVFLRADEAGVGNGIGLAFFKKAADFGHVLFYFWLGEAFGVGAGMRREGEDGGGPFFADFIGADPGDVFVESGGGEVGKVEGRFQEEAGAGGNGWLDEGWGVGFGIGGDGAGGEGNETQQNCEGKKQSSVGGNWTHCLKNVCQLDAIVKRAEVR